jgi:hypothetical protein
MKSFDKKDSLIKTREFALKQNLKKEKKSRKRIRKNDGSF